jgi:hypothetical protein
MSVEPSSSPLPPILPQGGSKWAKFFAGPKSVQVSGPDIVALASATVQPDGSVTTDGAADERDMAVFPIAAGEKIGLGRFITGALAAFAHNRPAAVCCGAPLTRRQAEVLEAISVLDVYITLAASARFRTVFNAAPGGVPGPHIRALADLLRRPAPSAGTRIAILPVREREKFSLVNRASLTAWLRAKKIMAIEPEVMKLTALAECLAAASMVVLADPEQAGLLGLCSPGCKILEIAPEGWLGAEARCVSAHFGLEWVPFLAAPPSYPLLGTLPFGALVPLSYEIPIRALGKTLDSLG